MLAADTRRPAAERATFVQWARSGAEAAAAGLGASGEGAAARAAQARFYLALAEQARVVLCGPDHATWACAGSSAISRGLRLR